jgi:hypothetical protein
MKLEDTNDWIQPYLQDEVFKFWETDRLKYVKCGLDLLPWLLYMRFKNNTHNLIFVVDEYSDAWVIDIGVESVNEKRITSKRAERIQVLSDYESDVDSIVKHLITWFEKVLLNDPDTRLDMLLNVKPIIKLKI